jgi:hypothetical protein
MFELILLDRVVLIHDENRNKDDWEDSEMYCKTKDDVRNVSLHCVRLSLCNPSVSSLESAHAAMGLVAEKKVHKGKDECHDDALTVTSDSDINVKRVKTIIDSGQYA